MIEKLKMIPAQEIKAKLRETIFGDLLADSYVSPLDQPPSDIEVMNKINEIIDYLNGLGKLNGK